MRVSLADRCNAHAFLFESASRLQAVAPDNGDLRRGFVVPSIAAAKFLPRYGSRALVMDEAPARAALHPSPK